MTMCFSSRRAVSTSSVALSAIRYSCIRASWRVVTVSILSYSRFCSLSSSHRNGDYVITTTRHYDVRRAGTTQFMGVPVDGSTKMPNGHMDAIEPYDYRAFQPFSTAYLPGYMADKYDEDADTCQARAHSRMRNSVSSELSASITGYNSVSTLSENISIDYTAKHYALLPVWMLHTKWQGKDYLFAMNGQTGKLVGDLPVDKRKVAAWFAGISVPLMILLAFLL